jgi:hypothetical protein
MEVSGQLHALAAFPPGLGGPQNRSGCGGEKKKNFQPPHKLVNM